MLQCHCIIFYNAVNQVTIYTFRLLEVQRASGVTCIYYQGSSFDAVLTAESLNSADEHYGNYSMGPVDAKAELNGTTRVACMQVRCPSFNSNGSEVYTVVRVTVSTGYGACKIR